MYWNILSYNFRNTWPIYICVSISPEKGGNFIIIIGRISVFRKWLLRLPFLCRSPFAASPLFCASLRFEGFFCLSLRTNRVFCVSIFFSFGGIILSPQVDLLLVLPIFASLSVDFGLQYYCYSSVKLFSLSLSFSPSIYLYHLGHDFYSTPLYFTFPLFPPASYWGGFRVFRLSWKVKPWVRRKVY